MSVGACTFMPAPLASWQLLRRLYKVHVAAQLKISSCCSWKEFCYAFTHLSPHSRPFPGLPRTLASYILCLEL